MDIGDIAARAGVSRSTVSYALSGKRPISPATRERIENVMREVGYVPNAAAQALKRGSMQTLGFVMPPADRRHLTGGQLEMVGAAVETAAEADYDMLLSPGGQVGDASFERLVGQRRVDGMLLTETRVKDARVTRVQDAGLPFVLIGRTTSRPSCDWVDVDHDTLVRECLRHLVEQGRTCVVLINRSRALVDAGYGPAVRSHRALTDEGRRLGVAVADLACDDNFNAARELVARMLVEVPDVDGIITINEASLPGLMPALVEAGRRVPDDVSVCGVAMAAIATNTTPPMTACDNPVGTMARTAVQTLIGRLQGREERTQVLLAPPLVVRDSSRNLRRRSA